ncbi:transmembrane 6 superfamily member 1 [Plakobranchus ocellatus]|uniref:Transmembrane 6 superfamily member 1 n=1 Tax=Plakobranchus ocellatus TaxID=259542 RepID=A0AAV4DUW2_9GAST|nr:transmembrane 6 superfamily member 1 [Plakobranchus ocellatus]
MALGIALQIDGYISNFIGFYFAEGEPYLNTAHGTVINYWDGTVHFFLYLAMIVLFCNRLSYREVGLYWAGSLLNSMVVLLLGAVTGNHPIKLSIFVNTPYLLLPIITSVKLLHERPPQARSFLQFPNIFKRPVDFLFLLYFGAALCISIYRALAAMGGNYSSMKLYVKDYDPYLRDPTNFPFIQVSSYAYFFVTYYLFAIYGLLCPGQHWMADWSLIHAGAAAQGQMTYILGARHHHTNWAFRFDTSGPEASIFYGINLTLLLVPQLFAIWCLCDVEKFGRSNTVYKMQVEENGLMPLENSDAKKKL